jgi:hypothetical protein
VSVLARPRDPVTVEIRLGPVSADRDIGRGRISVSA